MITASIFGRFIPSENLSPNHLQNADFVPSQAICDDYDFAGHPYRKEPVPESQVSARPPLSEYSDRPRRRRAKTGLDWIDP